MSVVHYRAHAFPSDDRSGAGDPPASVSPATRRDQGAVAGPSFFWKPIPKAVALGRVARADYCRRVACATTEVSC